MMDDNNIPIKLIYNPEQSLEDKILLEEVLQIIRKMPKHYQDVLVMIYVEDLKPKEIAKIFNTTVKNVSIRKRRAIKKLDQLLKSRK
jgi:RNA polymerase sigma factor (sigma-70 family)